MAEQESRGARVAGGLLTAGALLVVGWGLGHFIHFKEEKQAVVSQGALPVVLRAVTNAVWNPVESYVGHVEPTLSVDVLPQVEGYIKEVHFKEGATVKAGDLLYTIDDERYSATLRLRDAQLQSAEAEKARADRYLARLKSADARGITQSDLDTAISDAGTTAAKVEEAKANIGLSRYDEKHTKIYAPIGGVIGKSAVYPGDFVSSSKGALARIVQSDPIRVNFPIPDRDYYRLRHEVKDDSAGIDARRVRIRLPDGSLYNQLGHWDFRDNEIDSLTATLQIRLSFANPADVLIPNTYVTVETDSAKPSMRLQFSDRGLVDLPGGGTGVWIVGADMKAHLRKITVTGLYKGSISFTGDVPAGTQYVYEGKQKLFEGAQVKLSEVE